jgi:hypothetical protein
MSEIRKSGKIPSPGELKNISQEGREGGGVADIAKGVKLLPFPSNCIEYKFLAEATFSVLLNNSTKENYSKATL